VARLRFLRSIIFFESSEPDEVWSIQVEEIQKEMINYLLFFSESHGITLFRICILNNIGLTIEINGQIKRLKK